MQPQRSTRFRFRPTLAFVGLLGMLSVLALAGGASRADAPGQIVVRGAAALLLIIVLLFSPKPDLQTARPVLFVIMAGMALCLLQLVPLPPVVWQSLPGRSILAEVALASGQAQSWRPWSIVPGATINATASLIAPLAVAVLVAGMTKTERIWLPGILLGFILAETLVGLLQFSGVDVVNTLVDDTPGAVSGTFANRNHFALLLATGCLLAPAWAFAGDRRSHWRVPIAAGLILVFLLTILASGSRAGLALGAFGLVIGLLTIRNAIQRMLRNSPKWALPAMLIGLVCVVTTLVIASVMAGRAVSIDRVINTDVGQEMRTLARPTIMTMIGNYFPMGSGLGGFDPIFRISEPFDLLRPTYFNHAHNDWLEIVLDAGLPGLLVMAAVLFWWGKRSLHAWRGGSRGHDILPRLGSMMLLFVFTASIFDYPARVPTIMAIMAIAGLWLSETRGATATAAAPLPVQDQHL